MNLIVKQIVKKIKKVDGLETTIYSCSLEGMEMRMGSGVWGKLTLESENPESLKAVVAQAIDAEVDILFTNSQKTLDEYEEKLENEFREALAKRGVKKQTVLDEAQQFLGTEESKNDVLLAKSIEAFGVEGTKQVIAAAKEIVSGKHGGKTFNINIDRPGSEES